MLSRADRRAGAAVCVWRRREWTCERAAKRQAQPNAMVITRVNDMPCACCRVAVVQDGDNPLDRAV